jgi:ketosteroid isomerase-like protein
MTPQEQAAHAEASAETRRTIEAFYGAIGAWDADALRQVLHDDAELHQSPHLPYGRIYRGPEEMMELWKNVILPLADPGSAEVDTMIFDGDHAAVIASAKSVHGARTMTACEDYVVRDGKIARIRVFWFDPDPVIEEVNHQGLALPGV